MNLSDSRTASSRSPQRPIERTSASEAVFRALLGELEAGEHPTGSKLPSEAELGARYGVSRSVIREALRSCAALGLTRTETGRGTFVVSTSPRRDLDLGQFSASDLLEARPHIEVPAARLAAARRTPADLEHLNGLMDEMLSEDDPVAWVQLDAAFHGAIAQASGNRVFAHVVADIRDAMAAQSETVNLVAGRAAPSHVEHVAIVDAICLGDEDAAARAMQAHLTAVRDAVATITRS